MRTGATTIDSVGGVGWRVSVSRWAGLSRSTGTVPLRLLTVHCIAKPARYGNTHAIPYMACNVATARRPE